MHCKPAATGLAVLSWRARFAHIPCKIILPSVLDRGSGSGRDCCVCPACLPLAHSKCMHLPCSPRVLDLGSGSGRDCYVASALVGEQGSVTGVDMTPAQLAVARKHAEQYCTQVRQYRLHILFLWQCSAANVGALKPSSDGERSEARCALVCCTRLLHPVRAEQGSVGLVTHQSFPCLTHSLHHRRWATPRPTCGLWKDRLRTSKQRASRTRVWTWSSPTVW